MSNIAKTGVFGGVALLSAVLAYAFQGNTGDFKPPEEVGQMMFPDFKDPLAARSLAITRFDEALAEVKELEVKETDGVWGLPSHQGYPADAENRIRDATNPFVDLEIIRVVSDVESSHSEFGVKEPSAEKTKPGDEGVGTRVVIKDDGGKPLVDMIIGKAVKEQEGQRYARRTGKSRVYVVKADPDDIPIRFENWIEEDLLKTSSFDIEKLTLKDYSFDVEQSIFERRTDFEERLQISLSYASNEWKLDSLIENRNGQMVESKLLDTEELSKDRLNSLRDAIAELKIVDVEKKPDGLTADLKAGDGFFEDQAGGSSLVSRGFYPVQRDQNSDVELLSSDGEVLATTKDGVEYVLRFGKVQGINTDDGEGKVNRYLLVSARVNAANFPEPELEVLPELPAGAAEAGAETSGAQPAESNEDSAADAASESDESAGGCSGPQDDDEPADETVEEKVESSDAGDAENNTADEASTNDDASADDETEATAEADEVTDPGADAPESSDASDAVTDATPADDDANAAAKDASPENADAAADTGTAEAKDPAQTLADMRAERERITKENNRKLDEHKDKLKKANDKVNELNYRFADWYYVISDDVFKKIHLGRADIIQESEAAKKEGVGLDSFNELKGGLQRPGDNASGN